MKVDHSYGENRNTAVVRVTLVLLDARCVNHWGTRKVSV